MRITLLGLLVLVGAAALLVYVAYELHRTSQANAVQPPQNPDPSTNP